ncbi:FliI/YscN family ATPase [Vibrio sp. D431a]|uniref:FliI/YscN family ATPase n=1 Tax=Vibrio sp. D431a TaxID=2837388 RepID=UPI002553FBF8|nr:FliI/YscN family ATPase [Vibrio sp. D431a]MDK9793929.1 FliI/YscN family ATPase [Vibrio sp. D431a]
MERIKSLSHKTFSLPTPASVGRVVNTTGMTIDVKGFKAPLGARCKITSEDENPVYADVIGFKDGVTKLLAINNVDGIEPSSKVSMVSKQPRMEVGDHLKGKVINPLGEVLLGGKISNSAFVESVSITAPPIGVSERGIISEQLSTGVKAIDSMLPLGVGQRIGLFAGTGVGKSVLMSMITKNTNADVVVIALVGERGREVSEFYEETLSEEARQKTIIVAAPADNSPILRMQCAESATAIAEHFRDKGQRVLLLVDSVTRYAQAQREVALSSGEPPATKGYPPSVFAKLPRLIERAGITKDRGAITAIYTVLTEGDDMNDPVADAARGVLDGHIVLSRNIASRGIYPAIEVTSSISRLAHVLQSKNVLDVVSKVKASFQAIDDNQELIAMGVVESGKNPVLDKALACEDLLWGQVRQRIDENYSIQDGLQQLSALAHKLQ